MFPAAPVSGCLRKTGAVQEQIIQTFRRNKVKPAKSGISLTLKTNDDGFYQAPYLIPGDYQITAEATGFRRFVREGILLRVNDNIQVDIELEVGTADQAITITADAPLLD